MSSVLYYTCYQNAQDAVFWTETREYLSSKNTTLTILAASGNKEVVGDDRRIGIWKCTPIPRVTAWLENHLDWSRLASCAQGYVEPYSRELVLDQSLGLLLQLALERPDIVLIYNDRRRIGNILRQLCQLYRIPFLVVERLPWPNWISVDRGGMLLDCTLFQDVPPAALPPGPRVAHFERLAGKNASTWWAQPHASTQRLDTILPQGKKIVLYIHQVDEDAQNFAYNPHFKNNAEALAWTVKHLPADGFILGKHHPKASASPELYRDILGARGHWTTTHSIEECLAFADAIVGVNSSLLFEAILTGKPTGSLGITVFHDREIFIQLSSPAEHDYLHRLIHTPQDETRRRLEHYRRQTAHILNGAFCLRPAAAPSFADRGPAALADFVAAEIAKSPLPDTAKLVCDAAGLLDATLEIHTARSRSRLVRFAETLSRGIRRLREYWRAHTPG